MLSASIGSMPQGPEYGAMYAPDAFGPHSTDSAIYGHQSPRHARSGDGPMERFGGPEIKEGSRRDSFKPDYGPNYGGPFGQQQYQLVDNGFGRDPFQPTPQLQNQSTKPSVSPPRLNIVSGSVSAPTSAATPSSAAILSAVSTTTDTTFASGSVATSSMLSATAFETAFQDYASEKWLIATTNALDASRNREQFTDAFEKLGMDADDADGYLRPSEDSPFDTIGMSTDSLSKEREATDEVLRRLHDPTTLENGLTDPFGTDEPYDSLESDEQSTLTSDAADEGMILLQATGDANTSEFDLVTDPEDLLEALASPLAVEASVGVHQAFDVAAEDVPIMNDGQRVERAEPLPQNGAEKGASTEFQNPLFRRAAATIGVSVMFGLVLRQRTTNNGQRTKSR